LVVYRIPDHPHWRFSISVTDDNSMLLIAAEEGCDPTNRLYYADLKKQFPAWMEASKKARSEGMEPALLDVAKAVDDFNASFHYIATVGEEHYFMSNKNASRNKVVSLRLPEVWDGSAFAAPSRDALEEAVDAARTIVPELDGTKVLEAVSVAGIPKHNAAGTSDASAGASDASHAGWLLMTVSEDCMHRCYVAPVDNPAGVQPLAVPLPEAVSVYNFSAASVHDTEVMIQYTSFLTPSSLRRMSL